LFPERSHVSEDSHKHGQFAALFNADSYHQKQNEDEPLSNKFHDKPRYTAYSDETPQDEDGERRSNGRFPGYSMKNLEDQPQGPTYKLNNHHQQFYSTKRRRYRPENDQVTAKLVLRIRRPKDVRNVHPEYELFKEDMEPNYKADHVNIVDFVSDENNHKKHRHHDHKSHSTLDVYAKTLYPLTDKKTRSSTAKPSVHFADDPDEEKIMEFVNNFRTHQTAEIKSWVTVQPDHSVKSDAQSAKKFAADKEGMLKDTALSRNSQSLTSRGPQSVKTRASTAKPSLEALSREKTLVKEPLYSAKNVFNPDLESAEEDYYDMRGKGSNVIVRRTRSTKISELHQTKPVLGKLADDVASTKERFTTIAESNADGTGSSQYITVRKPWSRSRASSMDRPAQDYESFAKELSKEHPVSTLEELTQGSVSSKPRVPLWKQLAEYFESIGQKAFEHLKNSSKLVKASKDDLGESQQQIQEFKGSGHLQTRTNGFHQQDLGAEDSQTPAPFCQYSTVANKPVENQGYWHQSVQQNLLLPKVIQEQGSQLAQHKIGKAQRSQTVITYRPWRRFRPRNRLTKVHQSQQRPSKI
jgi:hypothetical protein